MGRSAGAVDCTARAWAARTRRFVSELLTAGRIGRLLQIDAYGKMDRRAGALRPCAFLLSPPLAALPVPFAAFRCVSTVTTA